MMTIDRAPAHYGFGAVVVSDTGEAIRVMQDLISLIKDRAFNITDQAIVIVAGDAVPEGYAAVTLSQAEAEKAEQAISVLAKDIQNKTGVNYVQLANAGAIPDLRNGQYTSTVIKQIRTLLSTQQKATGAARFPLSTTVLTILGVSLIGGLTVWAVGRRNRTGTGRRRSRRRSRR